MRGFPGHYKLCDTTSDALRHRVAARVAAPQDAPFLMLGGTPRSVQGFAVLELGRRGVRFSAMRYDF